MCHFTFAHLILTAVDARKRSDLQQYEFKKTFQSKSACYA